jgi:predicted DNA-binding transcriptional regulator AlpA
MNHALAAPIAAGGSAEKVGSCVGWALRRVGTAHHYRVCAGTPFLRSKGEEWIDRMITQGFFPSPTLRRERRMGHPCSKSEERIDRMITQGFFPSPTLRRERRMGHPCEGWGTHAPMRRLGHSCTHAKVGALMHSCLARQEPHPPPPIWYVNSPPFLSRTPTQIEGIGAVDAG